MNSKQIERQRHDDQARILIEWNWIIRKKRRNKSLGTLKIIKSDWNPIVARTNGQNYTLTIASYEPLCCGRIKKRWMAAKTAIVCCQLLLMDLFQRVYHRPLVSILQAACLLRRDTPCFFFSCFALKSKSLSRTTLNNMHLFFPIAANLANDKIRARTNTTVRLLNFKNQQQQTNLP